MKCERQVVYTLDQKVQEARNLGMTNLSLFVRQRLDEYIENRKAALGQNVSGSQQHSPLVVQE